MKTNIRILFFLCASLLSCGPRTDKKLVIATAANMQFAMQELTVAFSEISGIECETVISSSGKLTAQIMEGAPFDVFVSADMKYPETLFEHGLTMKEPEVYAFGKLVLWSMIDENQPSIELLMKDNISHIAIPNPKTAPYGAAALEVLQHHNAYQKIENKLVYGESISQTNQFITTKAADIGFTAKSVVLSSTLVGKGNWIEIDPSIYSPITQGVVIIDNQKGQQESAQMFHDFLFSAKAKEILNKFGYSVEY